MVFERRIKRVLGPFPFPLSPPFTVRRRYTSSSFFLPPLFLFWSSRRRGRSVLLLPFFPSLRDSLHGKSLSLPFFPFSSSAAPSRDLRREGGMMRHFLPFFSLWPLFPSFPVTSKSYEQVTFVSSPLPFLPSLSRYPFCSEVEMRCTEGSFFFFFSPFSVSIDVTRWKEEGGGDCLLGLFSSFFFSSCVEIV